MGLVPLRRQLSLLAVAGVLPLALLAGVGLGMLYADQREFEQDRAVEISRVLGIAVEGELDRSVAALQVIASAPELRGSDPAKVDELVHRVLPTQPDWDALVVSDADGRTLVDSDVPLGGAASPDPDPESLRGVLGSRKPVVGSLGPDPGVLRFPIRVPVVEDGKLKFVLSAMLPPTPVLGVINRQGVTSDWIVSVFDRSDLRVARSRSHERYVGGSPSDSLRELMAADGSHGAGMTKTVAGDPIFTSYERLPDSGWSVAVGIPMDEVDAMAWRNTALYATAVGLSLVVGLGAALLVARRINGPMAQVRDAALAFGRGEPIASLRIEITEIHRVGDALAEAARMRSAIEAEREQLLALERAARADAEAANRGKDQFLAMLGHELRNPLAAVSNAALVLERTSDPETSQQARAVIARQVAHLARLTDDLLDASRALHGRIELRREPVDLAEVAAQVVSTLGRTGRTAGRWLKTDLQPAWVQGDPVRLDQVVTNLLVNAVKYTPADGSIEVRTRRDGDRCELAVADTGVGMPPELTPRVFDLFVQGERSLDRSEGGLGIGLTLVQRLAELHGGAATAASEGEGRGSVFTVTLPALDPIRSAEPGPSADRAPSRSVLVVEDNDDARETLRVLLEALGHRVETAPDGVVGLERALELAPDVLLVDLGLPRLDGFELARRLRASGSRARLVALTGYGGAESRARALEAGFDHHVTKPVEFDALVELLAG